MQDTLNLKAFGKNDIRGIFPSEVNSQLFFYAAKGYVNWVQEQFKKLYGEGASLFASPGRVNLIGEHTDYNLGFVLPGAIDKAIYVAIKPNDGKNCRIPLRGVCDQICLRTVIEQEAVAWAVASLDAAEIDRLNILRASITAMHNAISQLSTTPSLLLIDGNRFYRYKDIPHQCIIKGDGKYAPIAAASILAKTHRDEYMKRIAAEYPQYGWDKNMAYPTAAHREAIKKYGITPYHRLSYTLLRDEPALF